MSLLPLKRKLRALSWQLRQARVISEALHSRYHPIVAHIIPVRRCNLACTYCNEYDNFSHPVPTEVMLRRIDRLHELVRPLSRSAEASPCCTRIWAT